MKFRIKDEDGNNFDVEEVMDEDIAAENEEVLPIEDEASLSDDEIAALKRLAGVADKLISLLATEDKEHEAVTDEKECECEDEDEDEDEDVKEDKEEIVDTDEEVEEDKEDKPMKDSMKSFGAIENKKQPVDDSLDTDSVSEAWIKRYNGGNK